MFIAGLIVGLFVGVPFGVMLIALCYTAKDNSNIQEQHYDGTSDSYNYKPIEEWAKESE